MARATDAPIVAASRGARGVANALAKRWPFDELQRDERFAMQSLTR